MFRASCSSEQGGARLKAIIALIIVVAFVYSAIKVVPLYVANYQLQDTMQQEATYASVTRKGPDDIRADLDKKAQALGLPVQDNQILVTAVQGNVHISIDYTIPVDLAVYQLQLHFHPQANNASI